MSGTPPIAPVIEDVVWGQPQRPLADLYNRPRDGSRRRRSVINGEVVVESLEGQENFIPGSPTLLVASEGDSGDSDPDSVYSSIPSTRSPSPRIPPCTRRAGDSEGDDSEEPIRYSSSSSPAPPSLSFAEGRYSVPVQIVRPYDPAADERWPVSVYDDDTWDRTHSPPSSSPRDDMGFSPASADFGGWSDAADEDPVSMASLPSTRTPSPYPTRHRRRRSRTPPVCVTVCRRLRYHPRL